MKTLFLKILYFATICQVTEAYRYVVTTYTGDRFGAGTDARVFIKLFGTNGETKEKELEATGRDNFERGQLDTFLLDTKNVGTIKRAKIRHDNSWLGPGWFLEKVTVTNENGDYYDFPVHHWLDSHQDDGKTAREITPKPIEKKQKKDEIEASIESRQPLDCSWPQGLGNGKLDDSRITASTSFNDLHLPYHSRLATIAPNSLGGWCPYKDDKYQYLQFDLGTVKRISGVATQGLGLVDEWTTSYRMLYANKSNDEFKEYSENGNFPKHFLGNADQNGTVLHWLKLPFYSRYVQLSPFKWHGKGCLRAELYGCLAGPRHHTDDENVGEDAGIRHHNNDENSDGYIQVPQQHHQIIDDTASSTDPPTSTSEEHREEENTELHHEGNPDEELPPGSEGRSHQRNEEDTTGQKYENIPTKLVTDRTTNRKQHESMEERGEHKMLQTEINYDPISAIEVIPIVHLDFDEIKDKTIPDVSGHHNDAHLRLPVDVRTFSKSCERGVRMNGGDIYFDGEFFIDKPRSEVTIAAWIKLFSNGGQHSIFNTIGGRGAARKDGQYNFEVDRGRLRWFHRNEVGESTFNVTSPLMIPAHTWTHCAATYSSAAGKAVVFINAKQGATGSGTGILSQDWTVRAGIGQHKGKRVLNGEIDEFYIFNKALPIRKIQMLMKRCSFETECQRALGMQSKEIADAQITASSTYNLHKPFYGRMNLASFGGDPARTAWCAVKDDRSPFFEVQLPEMMSLTGVATQGLSLFDNWVTSYLFCYSDDRESWDCYKEKGYDKVFEANTDKNSLKRHHFHHAVDAKYVRIRPQSWYGNHLCMRVELYGCIMDLIPDIFDSFGSLPVFMEDTEAQTRNEIAPKESCNKPLGVSNGEVDDIHLTASSSLDEIDQPLNGRLVRESIDQSDIKGCWCAHDVNLRQYIEADLGEVKTITGIATQGYVSHDNWVVSYRLGFSDDANALEWYRENDDERLFDGNTDRSTIVKHFLKRPIQARYIRLNPRAWHGVHICMRFEIFGCKEAPEMAIARLALDEETQEFSQVPAHHSVSDFMEQSRKSKPQNHRAEIFPQKSPVSEEKAENKHFIPKKEPLHSSYHLLEEKIEKAKDSVPSQHKKAHEIKRIKPGHSSSRASNLFQISYPLPQISKPHPSRHLSNLTLPLQFIINTKPKFNILNSQSEKENNPVLMDEPIEAKNQEKIGLKPGSKENELAMLKIVNKLQDLSEDQLAAEMKGPILALAKEKILEDLTGIKQSKKVSEENCKRTGVCGDDNKIPLSSPISPVHPTVPSAIQQLLAQNSLHQQQEQQQQQQQQQQAFIGIQQQSTLKTGNQLSGQFKYIPELGTQRVGNFIDGKSDPNYFPMNFLPTDFYHPTIDAAKILKSYPELRSNGMTESTLTMLSARVPNLEERIKKHFSTKHRALAERNKQIDEANNRLYSTPNFMKNFKEYLQGPSNHLSSSHIPIQSLSTYTPVDAPGQSSFVKPSGIDEHPCRRDGTCKFPDALYHKPPHAYAPKPDVWIKDAFLLPTHVKDDTRLTPDSMIMQGPDPRYLDYYQSYIEGHPGVYLSPTTAAPTLAPSLPMQSPAPQSPYVELSTTIEGLPPGSSITTSSEVTTFEWTPFSICSVTCGRGEKKRFRRCSQQDCPTGGVEIETVVCVGPQCPEIDPYNWSAFTECSATCGPGLSSRYRLCTQHSCAADGYETEQVTCSQPACPVCLLDFEIVENHVVIDQSGWGNHGYLDVNVVMREHPQICGHYADMTNMGEVLFSAQTFLGKPRTGITIACWVNIQGDISGKHSIFSTVRRTMDNSNIGGYHLEINSGAVRWFHRDEHSRTVYSMLTAPVVISRVWMHFTVIYDALRGFARVYVDGKEQGTALGSGYLAEDWGYKASIGSYDFDDRRLNGWIDEFIMYDYALNEDQIFHLLGKMRCPTGKSTTIEIDAFKFETMNLNGGNMKRSIKEESDKPTRNIENINKRKRSSEDSFTSKINTKYKRGLNDIMLAKETESKYLKHSNATAQTLFTRMLIYMKERLQSRHRHNKIKRRVEKT